MKIKNSFTLLFCKRYKIIRRWQIRKFGNVVRCKNIIDLYGNLSKNTKKIYIKKFSKVYIR